MRNNIIYLHRGIAEQPRDYAGPRYVQADNFRGVRPIPAEHFDAILGTAAARPRDGYAPARPESLYLTASERTRIARIVEEVRKDRVQEAVRVFCLIVAVLSATYFFAEFVR